MNSYDVAVVGGGPAGLASALALSRAGLSVVLFEAKTWPRDRACGEGILPAGRQVLAQLGVEPAGQPIAAIAWHDPRAGVACARFQAGPGIGVRRTVLSAALLESCSSSVQLIAGERVRPQRHGQGWRLGGVDARYLVAADGPRSGLRKQLGLVAAPPISGRRFGWRQHLRVRQSGDTVEVHWADGCEAYVTPVAADEVGIAFLWGEGFEAPRGADRLWRWLEHFEGLVGRFDGCPTASSPAGRGPLACAARRATFEGGCFVGDALGFYDGITGEGLSASFEQAVLLGRNVPELLAGGRPPLERALMKTLRGKGRLAKAVLLLHRHPALRQRVISLLCRHPGLFERGLNRAVGATGKGRAAASLR